MEFDTVALYLVTYAVERSKLSGNLQPEFEDFEAKFVPLVALEANPDSISDNNLERIELAFET